MANKIKRVGRHYLTLQGCGTKDEALKVLKKITQALDVIYEDDLITTYRIRVLYNEEVIDHEALEPKEVLLFSDGQLPLIFCSISFDIAKQEESQTALDAFEAEFELKLFKSFSIGH
jgi:hypothetical protein